MEAESVENEQVAHVAVAQDDSRQGEKYLLNRVKHMNRPTSFLQTKRASASLSRASGIELTLPLNASNGFMLSSYPF